MKYTMSSECLHPKLQITHLLSQTLSVLKHKVEQVKVKGLCISTSSCPVFCLFLHKATKISTVMLWAKSSKEYYQECKMLSIYC